MHDVMTGRRRGQKLAANRLTPQLLALVFSLAALMMAFGSATAQTPTADNLLEFPRDVLGVESGGITHSFAVELALDAPRQQQGLMFREEMSDDAGMLFVFDRERKLSFWMKNTLIPLDIIFADRTGEIVHIGYNAQPGDLSGVATPTPAQMVLEINAGQAEARGIQVGDKFVHPAIPLPLPQR